MATVHVFWPSIENYKNVQLDDYYSNINSWKIINPGFNVVNWYEQQWEKIVKTQFGIQQSNTLGYLFPHPLQRMNIAKYYVLYTMGGIVIDVNVMCTRPLKFLTNYPCCLFEYLFTEKEYLHMHISREVKGMMLTSCMSSQRGHPFWFYVLNEIQQHSHTFENRAMIENNILWNGGGIFLRNCVMRWNSQSNFSNTVEIFEGTLVMPFSYTQTPNVKCNNMENCIKNYPNAVAVHQSLNVSGSLWMPFSSTSHWLNAFGVRCKNKKFLGFMIIVTIVGIFWFLSINPFSVVRGSALAFNKLS